MENTLKEKSLHPAAVEAGAEAGAEPATAATETGNRTSPYSVLDERIKLALRCADEKKGIGISALDLREITSFTDFFIVVSGLNTRQVQAISDEIEVQIKKQLNEKPLRIEGHSTAEWVLMDYGDFVVHIFENKARDFYDLERLWRDAKKVELPKEL
jgi:ribosome-associated protein